MNTVKRGEIYYADLSPVVGSEQGGLRPVLIVQNDIGNRYSPTVIAAAITSRMTKTRLPTHIDIIASEAGLSKDSVVLLEQIRTIDKQRLRERIGKLPVGMMAAVDNALSVSFGLATEGTTGYGTTGRQRGHAAAVASIASSDSSAASASTDTSHSREKSGEKRSMLPNMPKTNG